MTTPPLPEPKWKFGNEFAPYHHQASHCDPNYRDGWNHCYAAALESIAALEARLREAEADAGRWNEWLPWMRNLNRKPFNLAREIQRHDAALANERAGGGEKG